MLEGEAREAAKKAMRILERGDKTEHQLREKLNREEFAPESVEAAIEYVKGYRYLDDARYAADYVRYRQDRKSRQGLKLELQKRGVASDLIQAALEEEYESDERQQIKNWIVKKKYDSQTASPKDYNRIMSFLLRKGFQLEDIRRELLDITIKKV